ncbi:hypothetical protein L195_g047720, partial [Trifolium pratense]
DHTILSSSPSRFSQALRRDSLKLSGAILSESRRRLLHLKSCSCIVFRIFANVVDYLKLTVAILSSSPARFSLNLAVVFSVSNLVLVSCSGSS